MVLEELPTPVKPHIFLRGNPNQLGEEVPRRFLRVLSDGEPPAFEQGSGRLELARAIADPANPLTARVMTNRVWLNHFGTGLVRTPSDFGMRSSPPTHPELLDHLASGLVAHRWSLKWLHRQIVLSATYQQASDDRPACHAVDPENALVWKMNRQRLDFEATRDALLVVAGRLDPRLGGRPVKGISEPSSTRRTLYSYIDRLNLPGLFRTFDYPNPDSTSPERTLTTVPQQALFFMNNPLVERSAAGLLAREDVAAETTTEGKLGRMYLLAFGRLPVDEELEWAANYLAASASPEAGWKAIAQAILLANEFVFID